jgi:hypothetical protein
VHGLGEAAAFQQEVSALQRNGPLGHGAQRFRQHQHDGGLVFEQGHIDSPPAPQEDAVPVTKVLAANGPVPATFAVGFDVLAAPVFGRGAAVAGLVVLEIGLLALILLHVYSPKAKAPPVRAELYFFFYSKFRISCGENKSANFVLWVWLVSGAKSIVITLDFGLPS